MTKTIIEKVESAKWAFELAKDFEGSCPCADFVLTDKEGKVFAHSSCWRVSKGAEQDLYVWGSHPKLKDIAKALKKVLDDTEWYNPYKIKFRDY